MSDIYPVKENKTMKEMLSGSNFVLYDWCNTQRHLLYEQIIKDQKSKTPCNVSHARIMPNGMATRRIRLFTLEKHLKSFAVDIIYSYLHVPKSVLEAVNDLPFYKKRRSRRALIAVELLDIIMISLFDGKQRFSCNYHKGSNKCCLYSAYLFFSPNATSIFKAVIRVIGKNTSYVRLTRCSDENYCMKITSFA